MVGTDTWQYTHIVGAIGNGALVLLEPGFVIFAKIFTSLTNNISIAVNSFSVLFFFFAATYLLRATRTEAIYLFGYFAPQSFIMYSMNGLRIGLASMTFILAIQYWRRGKRAAYLSLLALAVSFHYTIIIAIIIFFFFINPIVQRRYLMRKALVVFFVFIIFLLLSDHFLDKVASYSTFERLSPLAGLVFVIKIPLLTLFIWQLPISRNEIVLKFYLVMSLLAGGLLITTQSYAGLRILNIMAWLVPLLFIYSVERNRSTGTRFHNGLIFVGFIGSLAILRNISGSNPTADGTPSPFLPYHFMWENAF